MPTKKFEMFRRKLDTSFLMLLVIAALLLTGVLMSCAAPTHAPNSNEDRVSAASKTKPVPSPTPAIKIDYSLSWNNAVWSEFVIKRISETYYPRLTQAADIETFCPKYHDLPRENQSIVLGELISAMARFESGWKPATTYAECNKSKCVYAGGCQVSKSHGFCMIGGHKLDNGLVISRGLLQISLSSSQGYGCQVNTPQDLHGPLANLECGLKILSRIVEKTGVISAGKSQYWSVIKSGSSYNKLDQIRAMVATTHGCR